jgi:hypothetical protein
MGVFLHNLGMGSLFLTATLIRPGVLLTKYLKYSYFFPHHLILLSLYLYLGKPYTDQSSRNLDRASPASSPSTHLLMLSHQTN